MKKKIIIAICLILCAGCTVYIYSNKKGAQKKNQQIEINADFDKVRQNAKEIAEKIQYGEYVHFVMDNIEPLVTEQDEIYELDIKNPGRYKNYDNETLIQEEYKVIQSYFEEEMDEDKVIDLTTDKTYQKSLKKIQNNSYPQNELPYLTYQDEENHKWAQIDPGFCAIWLNNGDIGATIPTGDCVAEYYVGESGDRMEKDSYILQDGKEITVAEPVGEIEYLLNEGNPYYQTNNTEVRNQVQRVYVLKGEKEGYLYEFSLRREIDGVLFENAGLGSDRFGGDPAINRDLSVAAMAKYGELSFRNGHECNEKITRKNKIEKCVLLEDVMEQLENMVGEESRYRIQAIELGYREKWKDTTLEAKPVWRIETVNETDEKETSFYIDVVTGEIENTVTS